MTLLSQMSHNIWQLSKQDMYFAVCLFMSLTKNYKIKQFHGAWRSFDKRNSQLIKRFPVQTEPTFITTIRKPAISLRQITVDSHSVICVFLSKCLPMRLTNVTLPVTSPHSYLRFCLYKISRPPHVVFQILCLRYLYRTILLSLYIWLRMEILILVYSPSKVLFLHKILAFRGSKRMSQQCRNIKKLPLWQ